MSFKPRFLVAFVGRNNYITRLNKFKLIHTLVQVVNEIFSLEVTA